MPLKVTGLTSTALLSNRWGYPLPGGSSKIEGSQLKSTVVPATIGAMALGPDGFFDGVVFDPDDINGYIQKLSNNAALHND